MPLVYLFVVVYVRWCAWRASQIDSFCRDPVFYLDSLFLSSLRQPHKPLPYFGLIKAVLLDLVLDKIRYRHGKGGDIEQFIRDCIYAWRLRNKLMYQLFHHRVKDCNLEAFGQASAYNCFGSRKTFSCQGLIR